MISAKEAKKKLIEGNRVFIGSETPAYDVSAEVRRRTAEEGQEPYAVIITCSDSRVIPESIFSAGIGELFVIRTAGNVIDAPQLGSIEYAMDHLGVKLIVLLGHTQCGAVGAAVSGHADGFVGCIVNEIRKAIGNEKDDREACVKNVLYGVNRIEREFKINDNDDIEVIGAVYHIDSGEVEFL